jgi:carbamoyl-phosphate synthase small subunit
LILTTPAVLALEDGTVFRGLSIGASGTTTGEVVFNTAMTGYQEILTDPSYARQIVTLTYPHIGNTGTNPGDLESPVVHAAGLVIRDLPETHSNWRATGSLTEFLVRGGIVAIAGVDTRKLTRILREKGAQSGCIASGDTAARTDLAVAAARRFPGLKGMDLAKVVSTRRAYQWNEGTNWALEQGRKRRPGQRMHVVAYDFGVKRNILRQLADHGCRITVVPAQTKAGEVLRMLPDGVFLSNGPGDPEPCTYAIEAIREFLDAGTPLFGICLWSAASRARERREDDKDEVRPSWREPPGARPRERARPHIQPEPRFRRGRGDPAIQHARDPPFALRRLVAGNLARRQARLRIPRSPRGEPGPARTDHAFLTLPRIDAAQGHTAAAQALLSTCRSAETSRAY